LLLASSTTTTTTINQFTSIDVFVNLLLGTVLSSLGAVLLLAGRGYLEGAVVFGSIV
jgi:hypothetical protein